MSKSKSENEHLVEGVQVGKAQLGRNPYQRPELRIFAISISLIIIIFLLSTLPEGSASTESQENYIKVFDFETVEPSKIASVFSIVFLIALFMERAMEFFIELWRGEGKTRRELKRDNAVDREDKERWDLDLKLYQIVTNRITLWTSFIFGLLISASGFRVMQPMFSTELESYAWFQIALFSVLDALLTAGMISGGSEGIHKLSVAYSAFMDSTAKLAKDRSERTNSNDERPKAAD